MDNPAYLIIAIFFVVIGGITVRAFYNTIAEKRYNDSQPVITKDAKISAKRTELSGGGKHSVSTSYYTTFEFDDNKQRLELEIDSEDFGLLADNDAGKLTFQGRRFIKFER